MSACIFVGPTLPPHDKARALDAAWLPPAKHGDVYRAVTLLRPRMIGIVDGYFQSVPSVWHKEILWALHQGVHVFGAASMGALRATELAPFGMRGIGRIFEAFCCGKLADWEDEPFEDDDEVAVVHGPPESGYIAASEAMVNIRCTLANAERAGVISSTTRARLAGIAKNLFFPQRNYEHLLALAGAQCVAMQELSALEAWLPAGRVNQKRADALAMLEAMQMFLAQDPEPAQARFHFEHTTLWERALGAFAAAVHDVEETRVLNELRLDAARWDTLQREVRDALMAPAGANFSAALGPCARRDADHQGPPAAVEDMLDQAARMQAQRRMREQLPRAVIERQILARIRSNGEYSTLRARAEDKRARIAANPGLPQVEEFSELQLLELTDWYFSQALGREIPDDLAQCVRGWGYPDLASFHRAMFHEYVYRQMVDDEAADSDSPQAPTGLI